MEAKEELVKEKDPPGRKSLKQLFTKTPPSYSSVPRLMLDKMWQQSLSSRSENLIFYLNPNC